MLNGNVSTVVLNAIQNKLVASSSSPIGNALLPHYNMARLENTLYSLCVTIHVANVAILMHGVFDMSHY